MKILPKFILPLLYVGAVVIVLNAVPASGQQELDEEALDREVVKLFQAKKYAEVIPVAQKLLELREKRQGPMDPILYIMGLSYNATGNYTKAETMYQRALVLGEKSLGPDDVRVANILGGLATVYYNTRQYTKAEAMYQRDLAIREKALGPQHPDVATSLMDLANVYDSTAQYAKMGPLYQRALAIREKSLGSEHPDVAKTLNALALLYYRTELYEKAEPIFQRALMIYEKALGPEHLFVGITLHNLAGLYLTMGQLAKAEPLFQRSLTIREKTLGPENLDVADTISGLATVYLKTRQYAKAETHIQRTLAIREKALGPEHTAVAWSLNDLAGLYEIIDRYSEAEPLYQRSLAIREKRLGINHPDLIKTLQKYALLLRKMNRTEQAAQMETRAKTIRDRQENLQEAQALNDSVTKLYKEGKYTEALPLAEKMLEMRETVLGADHFTVAQSLNTLAELYEALHLYAKAEPLYQRAVTIWEKVRGPDHPDVATALNNLATLYEAMGAYQKAEPLLQRAVAIQEKAHGPDHPSIARPLDNLAWLYFNLGNAAKAEPLYLRALAIQEKATGPNHPDVAFFLGDLAKMYDEIGLRAKAEPLYERALAVREKTFGKNHPVVARTIEDMAGLYLHLGNYAKAESLYQRALAIQEKAKGTDSLSVSSALTGLAIVYQAIGDYTRAEALYQRALEINEKALGPEHSNVATSLHNLAHLYKVMGSNSKVEPLYKRALAIREKALGPDHPDVADSLNGLAGFYTIFFIDSKNPPATLNLEQEKRKRYAKAEPLYQRALTIREKAFGPDHPKVAESVNNLAVLYGDNGDYAKAEPLFQRALTIWEKTNGPESMTVDNALGNLASLEMRQNHFRSALDLYKKTLAIEDRQIQNVFTFTTEDQKLEFIESISAYGYYEQFLHLIAQQFVNDREIVRDALELVLHRKGIVFDAQSRMREAVQGRLSEEERQKWDRLALLRGELSRLLLNKPPTLNMEQYKAKLTSLQQQIEQSEQRLATASAQMAKDIRQRNITIDAIAKILPKNTALIEFVTIRQDFLSSRYLAFVLRDSGQVSLFDLGVSSVVDPSMSNLAFKIVQALHSIKLALESRDLKIHKKSDGTVPSERSGNSLHKAEVTSLHELYTKLWAPLEQALETVDKIFISPDGELNRVPFAALMDKAGRYLVERYRIAYVSSGRELAGMKESTPQSQSDLLLVANPAYDNRTSGARQMVSLRSRDFKAEFEPLPGTEREAREIPPLVSKKKGQQVLIGEQATESMVKAARSPRVLHLATHGFFLPDENVGVSQYAGDKEKSKRRRENPLVRSGLAFAGANHASTITDGDDGILTALEITGMDLYGTDLVVLSACDTGVGEVKTGEGVFGMRRAFALAGAKNLLMSLWPVSDEITATQMKAFYQNLQTLPPAEALRQAQLETIKQLNANSVYGGTAPPGLWAPFILQGAQALGP